MSRRGHSRRLERLGDLGLREQRDVARDLPIAPVATPSAHASVAGRSRVECHGASGTARASSEAMARATSMPRSPNAASVPEAPPSWSTRARSRASRTPALTRSSADIQPAALSPNVIGVACCSHVRPTMTVFAWRVASAAAASPARSSDASTIDGRIAQLQHHGRVDDVLARGAPVHEARGIRIDARDALRQLAHEWNGEIARTRRF